MNRKAVLVFIEKHIEKGIFGVAAAFSLSMAWMYLIGTPNKVSLGRGEFGPRELFAKARETARELEVAARAAKPDPLTSVDSAKSLLASHDQGIFAEWKRAGATGPNENAIKLTPAARTLTGSGSEILVPGLREADEPLASVALITPLAPEQPAVCEGHSVISRGPAPPTALNEATDTKADAGASGKELHWASVAAYWTRDPHKKQMIESGYAAYRAKVYVASVEVERQELLASGQWSPAKIVEGSQAMPEAKIREPAFDDKGMLINKQDVEEGFNRIRAQQNAILQPAFHPVLRGDQWHVPPIAGFVEIYETPQSPPARPKIGGPRPQPIPPQLPPKAPSDVVNRIPSIPGSPSQSAARNQIKEYLKNAKAALKSGDYDTALGKAQSVESSEHAIAGDRRTAKEIVEIAQQKLAEKAVEPDGPIDSRRVPAAAKWADNSQTAESPATSFVTHPVRTNVPAVFYHDDTVEPGKTYRYRTRVNLWNRYVGQIKALKNPEDAKKAILHGEWSLWSDPVTITPTTRFFVSSLKPGTDRAVVEVWKWISGKWIKRNFEPGVGEIIGGDAMVKADELGDSAASEKGEKEGKPRSESFSTGAVVLDIRVDQPVKVRQSKGKGAFEYRDQKSLVLVYLDPADGQVKERVQVMDNNDPLRKKLKSEGGDGG